jgi:hypothetical protein
MQHNLPTLPFITRLVFSLSIVSTYIPTRNYKSSLLPLGSPNTFVTEALEDRDLRPHMIQVCSYIHLSMHLCTYYDI